MRKWFDLGVMVGVVALALALGLHGCGSDMLTGIGIGVGTSTALTEGQKLAQQSKAALVAELIETRAALEIAEAAEDPAEIDRLTKQLDVLEEKKEYADMTEGIADKVVEGLGRDWATSDSEKQRENYMWVFDGILGLLFASQYRKNRALEKGVAKNSAEAEPKAAEKLYADIAKYRHRVIP